MRLVTSELRQSYYIYPFVPRIYFISTLSYPGYISRYQREINFAHVGAHNRTCLHSVVVHGLPFWTQLLIWVARSTCPFQNQCSPYPNISTPDISTLNISTPDISTLNISTPNFCALNISTPNFCALVPVYFVPRVLTPLCFMTEWSGC